MTDASGAGATAGPVVSRDVVCPFCGLGCDDLTLRVSGTAVQAEDGACGRAASLFRRGDEAAPGPRVCGREASLDDAIAAAAELLAGARSPVYAGLGADVDGVRAVLRLAAATGGSVDHYASPGMFRNLSTSQRRGWIATTFAEVRNRCDLFVVVGPDPSKAFHQLYARVTPRTGRFLEGARRVVFLGGEPTEEARAQLEGSTVETIAVPPGDLVDALSRLRALIGGAEPPPADPDLKPLAEALKAARYAVLAWSASSLDEADGDMVVERASAVVDALNVTTRAACLPLSGKDNLTGAYHASLWTVGFPLRIGFRGGLADHDQAAFATSAALASGGDVLVWTSAFRPEAPPDCDARLIAIAHPATEFEREPEVFIPVGQPGLDHAGLVFRADSVVGLPLKAHRDAGLTSVAEIVRAIAEARP
jgi:formylmethanofuran dehydrogenase subunit B